MWKGFSIFKSQVDVNNRQIKMEDERVAFESAKVTDIYVLQTILKKVYGKSPWSNTIFWIELTKKQNGLYLKVLDKNKTVGFVGVRVEGSDAHITNIAVLPDCQNQGFGKQLLEQAEKFALSKDCLTLSLEVKKSNVQAITLYKKFGFFENGVKPKYYKEDEEDAIDMVYVLEEIK